MLKSIKAEPILPREYKKPALKGKLCVFDCETDPFGYGLTIKPFTCGFYDGEDYVDFWGDDCIEQFRDYMELRREERLVVFCHNLGGFDIHFLYDLIENKTDMLIIGTRIAKCTIVGQEWRDSYKLAAVPLAAYHKDEFDYTKMLREVREDHRDEICKYQRADCMYLYDLVKGMHEFLGDRITIGNAAINLLQSTRGFQRLNEAQDRKMRPYFFGGRTQCFETGVLDDEWKVYDVNSMYPFIMATVRHPISNSIHRRRQIGPLTAFATIDAVNDGCLPTRGGVDLNFTNRSGIFHASIHEINAGLETGTLRIKRVIEALDFETWATFEDYVMPLYERRLAAKASGDKLQDLTWKLCLNNAFGKFCQSPDRYSDHCFTSDWETPDGGAFDVELNPEGWKPKYENGPLIIWQRKQHEKRKTYFNVATGASITGAARAYLHRALCSADRPVYCDTDSIICRGMLGDVDPSRLGAWKLEATGSRVAIAGKKTYALFDGEILDKGVWVKKLVTKKASKGVGLNPLEILRVAQGEEISYTAKQPTFSLDGKQEYGKRKIRATG
jgi:hypothetical protein